MYNGVSKGPLEDDMAEDTQSRLIVIGFENEYEGDALFEKLDEWQETG